ncbi:DUF58 domain-containing protein [Streptomonospora nanhaiensis]|uniref:Uncharacterized protein (DUF58 family) n=1 Tax=Streptomonospora nanhaiensis TaxID=1323731 RepID=A0A853BKP2_9ACTN|nr:DUF58 domain-containing protein [Streptomonospora nanhaiensis]MBV2362093.1 DUF58 domain-containing protein [Streptomonospora nanhaiensis]MBX9390432.1 DUF58 domain-containing protein [Streptomonospora nanhaiensis]NYI96079.1 uncharacterized protein (DUF58 family) [Streptomonospora nanhaiensis]
MAVTGRAVLAAFAAVLVVLIAGSLGMWLAWTALGLLAAALLVDLLLAASPRAVRFERSGDTSVRLGETAHLALVLANPGRRRLRGRVRDAWAPSAGAQPRSTAVSVPAGGRLRLATALTPSRRGDQFAAGVTVRSVGPLGLAARQCTHTVPWTVRALPPFHSRRHLPGKLSRLRELDGQHLALVRGQGSEFDSLREYVPGDDVRSIDWRATARRDGVVVRTWRPERDRRILIVLDTGRTSAGRVGDVPRLDHAMDAALLLAALAGRAGDRVDLLAYDRRVRAQVRSHGRGSRLPQIVQAMAPLEPELVESDPAGLVATILGGHSRTRQLVVLLTDLNAAALEEGLLPRLPALTARHLLMVAAVGDPRVTEMAAERGTARGVYSAAAAERTLGERHRVTAELRRHGVEVVDADPDHIAPALADAYIALKAQGRL